MLDETMQHLDRVGTVLGRLDELRHERDRHLERETAMHAEMQTVTREALALRVRVPIIAGILGISRYRVYQIRDGRR